MRSLMAMFRSEPKVARPLYDQVVAKARAPHWYRLGGVPDTIDGRFATLATLLALIDLRLERGTDAAVAQPKAATKAVLDANDGLEPKLTEAEMTATLPLLGARVEGQPFGYMDPAAWKTFAGWMRDNGLIDNLPTAAELLSNATLKIYEGYPHGMLTTHADVINPDLLAFIQQ